MNALGSVDQSAMKIGAASSRASHDPSRAKPLDEKTSAAIQDFEGMLLAQMLQSIRESALGGWQEESDQSGATALEMAEGQLARMMSANGGLGLGKVLQRSLAESTSNSSDKTTAAK